MGPLACRTLAAAQVVHPWSQENRDFNAALGPVPSSTVLLADTLFIYPYILTLQAVQSFYLNICLKYKIKLLVYYLLPYLRGIHRIYVKTSKELLIKFNKLF